MIMSTKSPTQILLESPYTTLIAQGAEAKVFKTHLISTQLEDHDHEPVLLKYRFPKSYRHEILDSNLTKSRVASEARALIRCLKSGVNVPSIRMVDAVQGVIGMEWIDGKSVRNVLGRGVEEQDDDDDDRDDEPAVSNSDQHHLLQQEYNLDVNTLMTLIGVQMAKLHKADIIHGDLTTSNMMLRKSSSSAQPELIMIDFGLSYISNLVEDKAVDLYVLERAFSSTHPDSEPLFTGVLNSYAEYLGEKDWDKVKKRLDEVRLRGRKRSMVG